MLRAILSFVVLLALVIFLLSNRGGVTLGFWPFGAIDAVPLAFVTLAALLLGFILGWLSHLPGHIRARRRYRKAEQRATLLAANAPVVLPPEP